MRRQLRVLDHVVKLRAEIVRGFGRGSAQLGFPTANLAINRHDPICDLSEEAPTLVAGSLTPPLGACSALVC